MSAARLTGDDHDTMHAWINANLAYMLDNRPGGRERIIDMIGQ